MKLLRKNQILLSIIGACIPTMARDHFMGLEPVPIYKESELIKWEEAEEHLKRVVQDECQLVEDIIARATRIDLPSYQFLYGEMLTTGTCIDQNINDGVYYITEAAKQGLPHALYRLGQLYSQPKYLQKNNQRAIAMLEEASFLGYLPASILWAELLLQNKGSPIDYPKVYRHLKLSISTGDEHKKVQFLMSELRNRMPENKY